MLRVPRSQRGRLEVQERQTDTRKAGCLPGPSARCPKPACRLRPPAQKGEFWRMWGSWGARNCSLCGHLKPGHWVQACGLGVWGPHTWQGSGWHYVEGKGSLCVQNWG